MMFLVQEFIDVGKIHLLKKLVFCYKIGLIKAEKRYDEEGKTVLTPARLLDVAGGTGDIAFKIIESQKQYCNLFIN